MIKKLSDMYHKNFNKETKGLFDNGLYELDGSNPPRKSNGRIKIYLKKTNFSFSSGTKESTEWFRTMGAEEYNKLNVNQFGNLSNSIGQNTHINSFCGISPSSQYVKNYLNGDQGVIIRVAGTNNLYRTFDHYSVGQALLKCAGYPNSDVGSGKPFSTETGAISLGLGTQSKTKFIPDHAYTRPKDEKNPESDYVKKMIQPKTFGDVLAYFKKHSYVKQDVSYIYLSDPYNPKDHDIFLSEKI